MNCQHCKKTFIDVYKLQRHQKTAKFCLDIQNRGKESKRCNGCNKEFFSERELVAHSCRFILSQNNDIIQSLRDELESLKLRVKILEQDKKVGKEQSSLIPLTEDVFHGALHLLSLDDVLKGAYGYAMFAVKHIFKDRVYCSDISRRKVKYKDENGEIKTDNDMIFLRVKFFTTIKERTKQLLNEYRTSIQEKIGNNEWENSEEEDDFFIESATRLDYRLMVNEASQGKDTEFVSNFVICVCSELVRLQ